MRWKICYGVFDIMAQMLKDTHNNKPDSDEDIEETESTQAMEPPIDLSLEEKIGTVRGVFIERAVRSALLNNFRRLKSENEKEWRSWTKWAYHNIADGFLSRFCFRSVVDPERTVKEPPRSIRFVCADILKKSTYNAATLLPRNGARFGLVILDPSPKRTSGVSRFS